MSSSMGLEGTAPPHLLLRHAVEGTQLWGKCTAWRPSQRLRDGKALAPRRRRHHRHRCLGGTGALS